MGVLRRLVLQDSGSSASRRVARRSQTTHHALSIIKEASDIDTVTFTQRLVSAYLDEGRLGDHLTMLLRQYKLRRETMLSALQEQFPAGAVWESPASGVFIWVELPARFDGHALFEEAVETEQVAFIPGAAFAVGGRAHASQSMRLNFSQSSSELINEGIPRLGRLLRRQGERAHASSPRVEE